MSNSEDADILEKAADIIETVGWTRERFTAYDGASLEPIGHCALGAIAVASGLAHNDDMDTVYEYPAARALRKKIPDYWDIAYWNDHSTTSMSDVVDTMKLTAKELRNG